MSRRRLLPAALALGLLACEREASPVAVPRREVRAGGMLVAWTPVPDPIPLNVMFGLRLTVTPSSPTTRVTVDAGMPGHGHGMTLQPTTSRLDDGTWEARGLLFHMPGEWEITVRVDDAGATETARIPVTIP